MYAYKINMDIPVRLVFLQREMGKRRVLNSSGDDGIGYRYHYG